MVVGQVLPPARPTAVLFAVRADVVADFDPEHVECFGQRRAVVVIEGRFRVAAGGARHRASPQLRIGSRTRPSRRRGRIHGTRWYRPDGSRSESGGTVGRPTASSARRSSVGEARQSESFVAVQPLIVARQRGERPRLPCVSEAASPVQSNRNSSGSSNFARNSAATMTPSGGAIVAKPPLTPNPPRCVHPRRDPAGARAWGKSRRMAF